MQASATPYGLCVASAEIDGSLPDWVAIMGDPPGRARRSCLASGRVPVIFVPCPRGVDLELCAERADAGHVLCFLGGCWIEPGPVVGHFETQYVILLPSDTGTWASSPACLAAFWSASRGSRGRWRPRACAGYRRVPSQSSLLDRSALYGLASGRGETVVREHLWVDPVSEVPEVAAIRVRGLPRPLG
jgi:hypothetical protein